MLGTAVVMTVLLTVHGVAEDKDSDSETVSVLFIGDSISGSKSEEYTGYSWFIEESKPEWKVARGPAYTAEYLLSRLESRPDDFKGHTVIYFNCGLHSIRKDCFEDLETYRANLAKVVDKLREIDDKALLIWRTTTPIASRASGGRDGALVPVYNEASLQVMQEKGVMVDDLYAALMVYYDQDNQRGGKYLVKDGTHWNTESQRTIIAPHIVAFIEKAIEEKAKQP